MALISIPFTFSAGAVIIASQHNSNFSTIFSDYNGNIDNNNIVSAAGIFYSKLTLTGGIVNADINTSAGIVGSKLNLASPGAIGGTTPSTGAFSTLKVGTTNQGDILYDNGTSLIRLTPGTVGQSLITGGAGANPAWGAPGGLYTAGTYLICNISIITSTTATSYTKILEVYLPRGGTLTTKFGLSAYSDGARTGFGRIYRNGSAVGTERSASAAGTNWAEFSEDISGWSPGDLLQIYAKVDAASGISVCGGLRLYTALPVIEALSSSIGTNSVSWQGTGAPATLQLTTMGARGDTYVDVAGGATTTLYVKTAATTWTAK